jgi:hypothetical protein
MVTTINRRAAFVLWGGAIGTTFAAKATRNGKLTRNHYRVVTLQPIPPAEVCFLRGVYARADKSPATTALAARDAELASTAPAAGVDPMRLSPVAVRLSGHHQRLRDRDQEVTVTVPAAQESVPCAAVPRDRLHKGPADSRGTADPSQK